MFVLDGIRYEPRHRFDEYTIREGHSYYRRISEPCESDVWLDVGGHVGSWALRICGDVLHVHSYEPGRDNVGAFRRNITLNDAENVTLHPQAVVGGHEAITQLYISRGQSSATHSIYPKKGREAQSVFAENINDALLATKANKIKLDCEGAEAEIIPAIRCWDQIEELVMEYHFSVLGDTTYAGYWRIIELLSEYFPSEQMSYPKNKNSRWHTLVHCWSTA